MQVCPNVTMYYSIICTRSFCSVYKQEGIGHWALYILQGFNAIKEKFRSENFMHAKLHYATGAGSCV